LVNILFNGQDQNADLIHGAKSKYENQSTNNPRLQ